MRENASRFRASLVIFLGRASPARKILVRDIIVLLNFKNNFLFVRTRIFLARETRPRKITSEARKAEGFSRKIDPNLD